VSSPTPLVFNPRAGALPAALRGTAGHRPAIELHRRLPGYQPTALVDLPSAATRLGVGRILIKHEADRFGLPAFKVLGASWATWRIVCQRLGRSDDPSDVTSLDDLRRIAEPLRPMGLVTATDGNHGRGVARAAAWFGFDAHILMPAGTVAARIDAIRAEGAEVTVIDGDYDECVRRAASMADERHLVVSDTSWPGYHDIPTDIADGYATMFTELDQQLPAAGVDHLDGLVIPMGVGSLALSAVRHFPEGDTLRITAEPINADCLAVSVAAGEPTITPGPHHSMMVGMNCGTISELAWPVLDAGVDVCVTVPDEAAGEAMRWLAEAGVVAGETGAGTLGALIVAAAEPGGLAALGLDVDSTVVCLCTEGATDPVNYELVVGTAPGSVATRAW